jgi:hypothetical protein
MTTINYETVTIVYFKCLITFGDILALRIYAILPSKYFLLPHQTNAKYSIISRTYQTITRSISYSVVDVAEKSVYGMLLFWKRLHLAKIILALKLH